MTTLNWLNKKGFYPQIEQYLTKGKEKNLIEGILSLSDKELEEYLSICHPDLVSLNRYDILTVMFNDIGIKPQSESKKEPFNYALLIGIFLRLLPLLLLIAYYVFLFCVVRDFSASLY